MAEFVFQMIKARKSYGDRVILDDVTLSFLPGAKIGVVGPNGMGKSTLLKIIMDQMTPDDGEIHKKKDADIGYLAQHQDHTSSRTIYEELLTIKQDVIELDKKTPLSGAYDEAFKRHRARRKDGGIHQGHSFI